jgi:transposase-like protein
MTRDVLKKVFNISISHQTVINYIKTASAMLHPYIDACAPVPEGPVSRDETYITVNGKTTYTWFSIDSKTRAICGYNISDTRGAIPALSLLYDTFGKPEDPDKQSFTFVSDGNPSYDNAVMAYNAKTESKEVITKHKVVGLQNVNEESRDFRVFKQLVERLNRTYKFHTRPRAGFKTFEGAVTLTTLFVGFYNFMRPHSYLKGKPPVQLDCLKGTTLYHEMWIKLLEQVA